MILTFKPKAITAQLVSGLKNRTRDIVISRFGLAGDPDKKTLETIGGKYGITRERARQIINFALNTIKKSSVFDKTKDVFDEMKAGLEKKGRILTEKNILKNLSGGDPKLENHTYFLLVLGNDFTRIREDNEFYHRWTINSDTADKVHKILRMLRDEIKLDDLWVEREMISVLKKYAEKVIDEKISDEVALEWLGLSKIIGSNVVTGDWGVVTSPNIRPRGVRDLAFLTLKKEGSPLHFTEVSRKISDCFKRPANFATVHNELIKDKRFVLVGRGLYALVEWGYQCGTVKDMIERIIKSEGPSRKEDIIKKTLKERYVKENTVLVNLQNRNYFQRDKEGRYMLK